MDPDLKLESIPVQKCSRGIPTYYQIPIGIRQGFRKWGFIVRIQTDPDLEVTMKPPNFVFIPKRMRWNFGDVRDVIGTSQIGLPYRIPDGCRFFGTICSFHTQWGRKPLDGVKIVTYACFGSTYTKIDGKPVLIRG